MYHSGSGGDAGAYVFLGFSTKPTIDVKWIDSHHINRTIIGSVRGAV
jgi:hypothetical protein